jgi:hypothetical protein
LGSRGSESDRPTARKTGGMFEERVRDGRRRAAQSICYTFDTDSEAVTNGEMRALRCEGDGGGGEERRGEEREDWSGRRTGLGRWTGDWLSQGTEAKAAKPKNDGDPEVLHKLWALQRARPRNAARSGKAGTEMCAQICSASEIYGELLGSRLLKSSRGLFWVEDEHEH